MRLNKGRWFKGFIIGLILVFVLVSLCVYLFFFTSLFHFIWYNPLPPHTDDCLPPCETEIKKNVSIEMTGTLIDFQTASIGITSILGTTHSSETYYLALWQGYQVGKWEDVLNVQFIDKGALSLVLFDDLNINKAFNYTIGLGIKNEGDTIFSNICATLSIPVGVCPPAVLPATESGVCIKARYAQSILLDFWTPNANEAKKDNQWISVFQGGISPKPFTAYELISYEILNTPYDYGSLILSDLDMNRMTTYTVVYGMGSIGDSIPDYNGAVAATSFRTE